MDAFYTKCGFEEMQLGRIAAMLKTTYWAKTRREEKIRLSMQNSICFGVFLMENALQVGFARVLTDYATTYYLCDVVIDPEYRGNKMGYGLVEAIEKHMEPYGLKSLLVSRDACGLYEKFGYRPCSEGAMVKNFGA